MRVPLLSASNKFNHRRKHLGIPFTALLVCFSSDEYTLIQTFNGGDLIPYGITQAQSLQVP